MDAYDELEVQFAVKERYAAFVAGGASATADGAGGSEMDG